MELAVAVIDNSALQELEVIVNLMGIPAQAVEQIVKSKETRVFVRHLQGWKARPDRVDLIFFDSRMNLTTRKRGTYYFTLLVFVYFCSF